MSRINTYGRRSERKSGRRRRGWECKDVEMKKEWEAVRVNGKKEWRL